MRKEALEKIKEKARKWDKHKDALIPVEEYKNAIAAAEKWRVLEKKYPNFCKRFDVTIDALEGEGEKG